MDKDHPIGPGADGDDGVRYLPGVTPPDAAAAAQGPGATEVLTGCIQLVGLVIKLLVLLALLAFIMWFLVAVLSTSM